MFRRTRWTQEELEKLKEIHVEELAKGIKRLWVRITQRVNSDVRKAKRQAIQYKWKNFCRTPRNSLKLRENQRLIELLLTLIPAKGYKELSNYPQFKGITQSDLKNIFYSNVRSVSNFLHSHLKVKESVKQIIYMLKNRQFLQVLKLKEISFLDLRNKIHALKRLNADKRQINPSEEHVSLQLKSDIKNMYERMRSLHLEKNDHLKPSKTTIEAKENLETRSITQMNLKAEQPPINYPMSMQFLENDFCLKKQCDQDHKQGSLKSFGDWQNRVFPVKFNEASSSLDWLYSDF